MRGPEFIWPGVAATDAISPILLSQTTVSNLNQEHPRAPPGHLAVSGTVRVHTVSLQRGTRLARADSTIAIALPRSSSPFTTNLAMSPFLNHSSPAHDHSHRGLPFPLSGHTFPRKFTLKIHPWPIL
ncbi:hypothetical protein AcW1_001495 [Taiwanofungus camphoratus]|nr:hypothetical protein AcW1_001495 [Antrodia cinnamomea]